MLEKILPDAGPGIKDIVQREHREREAEKALEEGTDTPSNLREWALQVPERGVELDFEQFPFQRAWYSDEVAYAREACWMKAAQVGMSSAAWRWAAWRADEADRVIYFFPTDDDVTEFGDQRIEPSIQQSQYLLGRVSGVRTKHHKQIGTGWLILRGTMSKSAVQSVDADALVFDEYNYLHPGNLEQAERRVAGSQAAGRFPRIRRFGYPTLPGYGIDPIYQRSDRRVWHVTCPACGLEQPIEWEANMRWRSTEGGEIGRHGDDVFQEATEVEEAWRACSACEESLEPGRDDEFGPIHHGRWIATRPDSRLIGFHVSRLIVPRTDLIELVRNSRKTKPAELEAFWNNDLGLPFSPSEAALAQDVIEAACSLGNPEQQSGYTGRNPVTMGMDVASERALSVRISEHVDGKRRAIYIGMPESFEEAAELIDRYRPYVIAVDSMPERRSARALALLYPGRVFLVSYDDNNTAGGAVSDAFRYDPKKNLITVNRTEALDAMMDSIRQKRNLPLRKPPPKYVSQLMSPKRRTEEDAKGRPRRLYVSTGPDGDDYAHAEVYDMIASEMLQMIEEVRAVEAAAAGEVISDEQFGFSRTREVDDYDPGFGGV